jgi:peptidoglycan hydrolase-like protein with peptidoglycan-binding domain
MKKLLTIVLIASFAFVGAFGANAVTIEELQAQIATLLQQIAALQGTTTPTAPTTPANAVCFTSDLQLGMTSSDVTSLQTVLAKDPAIYPEGLTTGYFGPLTLAAVKKFQAANNIITTGYVGPLTRGALNAKYCVTTPVTTPTTPTTPTTAPVDATEGTLSATTSPTFVETTLKRGDTQKAILATKLEAKNSNIDVKRVDVTIAGTSIQP